MDPRDDGGRREQILSAAAKIATIKGLDGLSIGGLADHMGMSKSGLYAYFRSKEELQLETIEAVDSIYQDVVVRPAARGWGTKSTQGIV